MEQKQGTMRPFRKIVALSTDERGVRGVLITRALAVLEEYLGKPAHEVLSLTAGTPTGQSFRPAPPPA